VLSYARLFSVEQDFYNNGQGLSRKNCGGLSGPSEMRFAVTIVNFTGQAPVKYPKGF